MLMNASAEFVMIISLIFARIASALVLFPGIGATYVPQNAKIIIAVTTSLILYPILREYMPEYPIGIGQFLMYLVLEIGFGIIVSLAAKICFLSLDVVGTIVSMQSGLNAAMVFDPMQHNQVSLISQFLSVIAYASIFASDTHYLFFEAIVDSYTVFSYNHLIDLGDLTHFVSNVVNHSFILAFKLASPFIAVSIGFLISNGVLSRLMPNLQVFFVVTPVQIFVMFVILFIVINTLMGKFIEAIRSAVHLNTFL